MANYNTIELDVEPGAPLPQPHHILTVDSPMTGYRYNVHVTSIVALRWLDNGAILVSVRGEKRLVAKPESERTA